MKKKISILSSLCLTSIALVLSSNIVSCSKHKSTVFDKDSYKEYFKFDDSSSSDFRINSATATGNAGFWSVSRNNEIKEFTALKEGVIKVSYQDNTQLTQQTRKPNGAIAAYVKSSSGAYNSPLDYKLDNKKDGDTYKRINDVSMNIGRVKISISDEQKDAIKKAINDAKENNPNYKIDISYPNAEDEQKLQDNGVGVTFYQSDSDYAIIIETIKPIIKNEEKPFDFKIALSCNTRNQVKFVDEEFHLSTKDSVISLGQKKGVGAGQKFYIENQNFTSGKLEINYYDFYTQSSPTFALTIDCKNQVKQSFFTSAQYYQWTPYRSSGSKEEYSWRVSLGNTSDSLISWNSNFGYVDKLNLQQKGLYMCLQLSTNITDFKIYPTNLQPDPNELAPSENDGYIDPSTINDNDYSTAKKILVTNNPVHLFPDINWEHKGDFGPENNPPEANPFKKDYKEDSGDEVKKVLEAARYYSEKQKWNYLSLFIGVKTDINLEDKDKIGNQVMFEFTAELPDNNPKDDKDPNVEYIKDGDKKVKAVYKLVTNISILPFVPPQ